MAGAIIKSLEEARIEPPIRTARALTIAVAAIALAACASAPTARSYSERTLGDISPGVLRLFVDTALDSDGAVMLVSGSVMGDPIKREGYDSEVLSQTDDQGIKLVLSAASGAVADEEMRQSILNWTAEFRAALVEFKMLSYGQLSPVISASIRIARRGDSIDHIYISPLRREKIDIQFEIPSTLAFDEKSRPSMSNLIAHEIYHALVLSENAARMSTLRRESLPPLERALGEAAAMLFGQCVSLKSVGLAKLDENIIINNRPGGVLTDAELNEALAGGLDELPEREFLFIGKAIGVTIWASRISTKKLISSNDQAAASLLAHCTLGAISDPMMLLPLLNEIGADGVDAPPLELRP